MTHLLAPVEPGVVWVHGPDAVRFLNDLISQEIGAVPPGEVRRSLLLSPQGKIDFVLWALRGEEEVGLLTEDQRGDELVSRLGRYLIRVKVEIEPPQRDAWLVLGALGVEPSRWSGDRSGLLADISWPSTERYLVVGERPELGTMDPEVYNRLRIEAGEPMMGVDITDSTIPQETGLVPGTISFEKGCFLGQELVARLDSRGGRVNHHLRILRFAGPTPAVGNEVTKDGEGVGTLTSAAGEVGLALLRRGVEPGDVVLVAGVEAVVEAVPGE